MPRLQLILITLHMLLNVIISISWWRVYCFSMLTVSLGLMDSSAIWIVHDRLFLHDVHPPAVLAPVLATPMSCASHCSCCLHLNNPALCPPAHHRSYRTLSSLAHSPPCHTTVICWVEGYMRQVDIKQYQTHLKPSKAKVICHLWWGCSTHVVYTPVLLNTKPLPCYGVCMVFNCIFIDHVGWHFRSLQLNQDGMLCLLTCI
jgi:hypothetical protein